METNDEIEDKKLKRKIKKNQEVSEALKKMLDELDKRKLYKKTSKK
jgi:hypothetical protein